MSANGKVLVAINGSPAANAAAHAAIQVAQARSRSIYGLFIIDESLLLNPYADFQHELGGLSDDLPRDRLLAIFKARGSAVLHGLEDQCQAAHVPVHTELVLGGVPELILREADRLSFPAIERAIKEFAAKAEANTLTLEDLRGGTFSLTNGGVFGSLLSTPILNPPQVGILGLHKIEERPVARSGEIVIRPMTYVVLSYDHRVVDGREAVRFLVRVKELIEDPERLWLEG